MFAAMIIRLRCRSAKVIAGLCVAVVFASCSHYYQLEVPADIAQLPFRRGGDGFNAVAVTPWRYLGSRFQSLEFRYYYDRDNALHYREVSVARDRAVVHFEEMPYGTVKEWVTLRTDGQMFYFSPLQLH